MAGISRNPRGVFEKRAIVTRTVLDRDRSLLISAVTWQPLTVDRLLFLLVLGLKS